MVANGDIKSESDVRNVHEKTGVNGNYLRVKMYLLVSCDLKTSVLARPQ